MITLYGHGYIAEYISKEFDRINFKYNWLNHNQDIPTDTEIIVNAAGVTGYPNVDACEMQKDNCMNGNVIWPLTLEQSTNKPIIHISSGCVYTGYEKDWSEKDLPNFTFNNGSFYSACKSLAQSLLTPYMSKSYLFRIRMPFGPHRHPKNLLTKIESYNKLVNFKNSITQVEDLAKCVTFFIKERPACGIYNVCNPGSTDLKEISALLKINKEWFTEEEFKKVSIAPRSNCVLDTSKLSNVFKLNDVNSALEKTISEYLYKS